jgi:hypothetical protein
MLSSTDGTATCPSDERTFAFYRHALRALATAGVPFLVGGAYALSRYTGVHRDTKDIDVFIHPRDLGPALDALNAAGHPTEVPFPHWLAKARGEDCMLDIIYSAGNGVAEVDDEWFAHAVPDEILGLPARLCPPEETLWSKGFIMERERYDGADVAHLLRSRAATMDWARVLRRFGDYWPVLLSHLVLFGFIYPAERDRVPEWVMDELLARQRGDLHRPDSGPPLCRGPLLSREQYLPDLNRWGYQDARITGGHMTHNQEAIWTDAIKTGE